MAPDENILHEDDTRDVIDDQVPESLVTTAADDVLDANVEDVIADASTQVAVTDLAAPSATYVEAEQIAITNRINLLTEVLRDLGAIPSA